MMEFGGFALAGDEDLRFGREARRIGLSDLRFLTMKMRFPKFIEEEEEDLRRRSSSRRRRRMETPFSFWSFFLFGEGK